MSKIYTMQPIYCCSLSTRAQDLLIQLIDNGFEKCKVIFIFQIIDSCSMIYFVSQVHTNMLQTVSEAYQYERGSENESYVLYVTLQYNVTYNNTTHSLNKVSIFYKSLFVREFPEHFNLLIFLLSL